ncbi:MAG: hypothetical protein E7160_02460 [Firmicutes bacterium]|nr:hypothetical protein [Bacillota bacterium]
MLDCLQDALIDTIKLIPYLLITFIVLEFIEHKLTKKNQKALSENQKYGPIVGGLLGALPQCGFSSMASNLFSARVITMGTLIAVFLSTSDEMLPIMLSERVDITILLRIIIFKIIAGIIVGFTIDLIFRKNQKITESQIHDVCEHDHCSCNKHNIITSSIIHTLNITLFILIANVLINIIIFKIGEENVSNLLLHKNIFTYFLASLVGLIPNCAGSVIITELYLSNMISVGMMLAGLLTGSGLGILLLFKTNKNMKENIMITSIIYFTGIILGIIVDILI